MSIKTKKILIIFCLIVGSITVFSFYTPNSTIVKNSSDIIQNDIETKEGLYNK